MLSVVFCFNLITVAEFSFLLFYYVKCYVIGFIDVLIVFFKFVFTFYLMEHNMFDLRERYTPWGVT